MGQHNSFSKDIDMLSEAYGHMYGKKKIVEEGVLGAGLGGAAGAALGGPVGAGIGAAAGHALTKKSDEEDKTGGKSDHDLLDAVEQKHTAGKALLDKARSELDQNGSLSAHTRDSLARDEYGYGGEDAEMIYGDKPLTRREKDQHDAERAGVVRKGKHSFTHKEDKPYGHDFDWDDDEDAEDTDEADAGPEARRRKDEDEKAAQQGFRGKPATPAH